jgi:hypothetical protein
MDRQDFMGLYESYMGVYDEEITEEESSMPPRRSREQLAARAKEVGDKQTRKNIVDKYNKNRQSSRQENPEKYDPKEEVDLYDIVLEYLLDEGLCESVENAEIMMAHMSEGWVDAIVESYELDEAAIIMSVSRGGKPVYKLSKTMNRLQTAAARERQGREDREKTEKEASQRLGNNKATKSSIKRMNAIKDIERHSSDSDYEVGGESIPQSKKAGYGEADRETHLAHVRAKARARKGR